MLSSTVFIVRAECYNCYSLTTVTFYVDKFQFYGMRWIIDNELAINPVPLLVKLQ